ncbi:helix-hairpin-helix domain-containing protein [Trueperella pecoris]|uniref:Helix-hairpin-helix domain-containing protein n=1 Tax=Trueperella pecoris TaxID=2733571 RepID=A0A7M1QSJ3_9ACTO|nr:helix-hairpin-helix domain-containing protein [Trueperella pecoris]QOR44823.1 helix-hairpin-helix domain-containing protein [Trueperella pecoris]
MTSPPPRRPSPRRSPRVRHRASHWESVEGFVSTAMRMGAGDDVGALTTTGKKRRFVLDGQSLKLVALLITVLALAGAIGTFSQRSVEVAAIPITTASTAAPSQTMMQSESTMPGSAPTPTQGEPDHIVVHVSGEVAHPGIVKLTPPARINDALMAAGGPTPAAQLARINLAQSIDDGTHVHVPGATEEPLLEGGSGLGQTGDAHSHPAGEKVNINEANQAGLQAIPGVGPVTAKAIIAWREENGRFTSVEQLIEVTGIGPKTLEQLREHVRVS